VPLSVVGVQSFSFGLARPKLKLWTPSAFEVKIKKLEHRVIGTDQMQSEPLSFIFLNAFLMNNFVLALFLGICPFLGVSGKLQTAWYMGLATTLVMLVSSMCAYFINIFLVAFDIEFLRLISYIAVIASAVQLIEMSMKRLSPNLFRALGIFLPLITTNCAILGLALFQTAKEYNFLQSLAYSLGAGAGFILAIVLMAGLREKLDLANVPTVSQGAALSLMLAGLLSLTFMGFAGLDFK
jgi:electron transport complex protein RnfA